jgi:hypothetical protein
MKTAFVVSAFVPALCFILWRTPATAGTWNDHFSQATLDEAWKGNRSFFRIKDGILEGRSTSPVTPPPLNLVEIDADSTDCDVGCWINVVAPNSQVCTKGALILRHTGNDGYVFALHQATQAIEVYRLSTHEMLLRHAAKIELRKWYYVRAELRDSTMTFFVDGQIVGVVTDALYPSGSVGVAVQDADAAWFDDFTISGPRVVGNVDDVSLPELRVVRGTNEQVVLRFLASPPYDYFVQASSVVHSHDWETIGRFRAKVESFEAEISDPASNALRFYRLEKIPCGCR